MSVFISDAPAVRSHSRWPTHLDWPLRLTIVALLTLVLTLAIVIQGPDSRDVAVRVGPGSKPVASTGARASAPSLQALSTRLDAQIAAPWPSLQVETGRFRNILGGGTRYGEATLGYGLLQAGARADNHAQVHAGLKALSFAVRNSSERSRPSVFENLSIAAAYNIAKRSLRHDPVFVRARPRWEAFLESRQFKELSGQHPYDNHYLADAIATLELLRTGLTSNDPATVVGNQSGALAAVENLINERVPQMAGVNGVDVKGKRTFVLSDPPDNPLSYQGLSLGMYARAVHLLGDRASPAARETLKQIAQASWWIAAPDGDLGWYGRSQEESWGLAATAFGAASAANLPDLSGRRALDFRALSERALHRLQTAYGVGPRGLYITPAVRKAKSHAAEGLDGNAGGPSFTGITLMMLNWLVPEVRSNPRAGTEVGSDRDGAVQLSVRDSRIAVVRHGNVWFGIRMKPSINRPDDLRYDFGLQTLKLERGGRWIDLAPVRPKTGVPLSALRSPAVVTPSASPDAAGTTSTASTTTTPTSTAPEATTGAGDNIPAADLATGPPDSAGPVLMQADGSEAVPYGDSMRIRSDGAVEVTGGWRNGAGAIVRDGVTFVFAPTDDGIRMTFPRQAGDIVRYSAFLPGVSEPERRRHAVLGHDAVVSWSGRAGVHLRAGYASAVDPHMTRARLTFRSGDGPVRVKIGAAPTG